MNRQGKQLKITKPKVGISASLSAALLLLFLAGGGFPLRAEPLELAGPAAAPAAPAVPAGGPAAATKTMAATGETKITADNFEMDFAGHISTWTGNVVVTDARMQLKADKMIVHFDADNQPQRIEAIGNVTIEQPNGKRKARAGRAEYQVAKEKIVLTGKPVLTIGDYNPNKGMHP